MLIPGGADAVCDLRGAGLGRFRATLARKTKKQGRGEGGEAQVETIRTIPDYFFFDFFPFFLEVFLDLFAAFLAAIVFSHPLLHVNSSKRTKAFRVESWT
jgi:hypothetical protein